MYMKRKIVLTALIVFGIAMAVAAKKGFTLVIDPGHGGHDAGALGTYSKEKTINLNVALAFGRLVETNCPDVKVIYTRKTDVFIPLHQRADIANRNKADLFISIHTNALPKKAQARGLETYTLGMHRASDNFDVAKRENSVILIEKDYQQRYEGFDPNSSESYIMFEFMQDRNMAKSVELAKMVQKRTCAAAARPDKGVKQAGFLVLRETSMPSCLIELGFITTPAEEQFLNTDEGVANMGRGIYLAFCDYLRKYDKSITVPFKPGTPERDVQEALGKERKDNADIRDKSDKPEDKGKSDDDKAKPDDKVKPDDDKVKPDDDAPVFKVQVTTSNVRLKAGHRQLKGVSDFDVYQDGGLYKYTVGSSCDYNEIYRLRKTLLDKFPEAFIIAFKNGARVNIQEAIREFKSRKQQR